ncbi:MAG: tetratricopeptide repeat protein [Syntrophales bacterium]
MVFMMPGRLAAACITMLLLVMLLFVMMSAHPVAAGETVPNMSAEEWLKRGYVYEGMGNSRAAVKAYTQAIRINPEYADAYSNRGISYTELEEFRSAIRDFNRAIQLNSGEAKYYFNRGIVYGKCEEYRLAMVDFDKAISINRQYAAAYFWLGIIQSMYGDAKIGREKVIISARLGYEVAQGYLKSRHVRWN